MQQQSSRRRWSILGAGVACAIALVTVAAARSRATAAQAPLVGAQHASRHIETTADALDAALARLARATLAASTKQSGANATEIRDAYIESRMHYKHLEAVTEFYAPALAAALNSRRQEVDDDDAPPPSTLAPGGFPALELLVWPQLASPRDAANAGTLIDAMRSVVKRIRALGNSIAFTDAQAIEIGRLELARVATLGISGFDTPVTQRAMLECADALDGLRQLFSVDAARQTPELAGKRQLLDSALNNASAYLRSHADFNTFDRLRFITGFANPASRALDELRQAADVVPIAMRRGWRADAASVYDSGAFDARAYAAADAPQATPALIGLGERLFVEPGISGNGQVSCATCHIPARAFTDGLTRHPRVDGHGLVARHTPTLLNAALSPAQFADERAITLEEQVLRVIESPTEMGGSLSQVAATLSKSGNYAASIALAFGPRGAGSEAITPSEIRFALAAYVRSLVSLNSRFDEAIRGDTALLTPEERRGFTLFMGKAACGTCHFAPLFNGNTPPLYQSADVEVIGTPATASKPARTDADSGRAGVDNLPLHLRAFKTPSIRNAALTAPYMHNGVFRTVDDVIRFYDGGGGAGAGAPLPNQTLSSKRLRLTADEREAIQAFIGALTDTTLVHDTKSAYRHAARLPAKAPEPGALH